MRNAGLAYFSSTLTTTSPNHNEHSTGVFQNIMQSMRKNKRAGNDESFLSDSRTKRPRSEPKGNISDDEVIILDGPPSEHHPNMISRPQEKQKIVHRPDDKLPPMDIVNFFRLDPKNLCVLLHTSRQLYVFTFCPQPQEKLSNIVFPSQRASGPESTIGREGGL